MQPEDYVEAIEFDKMMKTAENVIGNDFCELVIFR